MTYIFYPNKPPDVNGLRKEYFNVSHRINAEM